MFSDSIISRGRLFQSFVIRCMGEEVPPTVQMTKMLIELVPLDLVIE